MFNNTSEPIEKLPDFAAIVDEMRVSTERQYYEIKDAHKQPYPLPADLLESVLSIYTKQLASLHIYENQLELWLQRNLNPQEQNEIERLFDQLKQIRPLTKALLALVD